MTSARFETSRPNRDAAFIPQATGAVSMASEMAVRASRAVRPYMMVLPHGHPELIAEIIDAEFSPALAAKDGDVQCLSLGNETGDYLIPCVDRDDVDLESEGVV